MLELKFRAWDKELECFEEDVVPLDNTTIIMTRPLTGECKLKTVEVVEQFTGIIDKNGKEIYSGDIVKFSEYWFGDTECPETIEVIKYDAPSFNDMLNVGYQDFPDWCEVIGNIHQNKELLE